MDAGPSYLISFHVILTSFLPGADYHVERRPSLQLLLGVAQFTHGYKIVELVGPISGRLSSANLLGASNNLFNCDRIASECRSGLVGTCWCLVDAGERTCSDPRLSVRDGYMGVKNMRCSRTRAFRPMDCSGL